MIRQNLFGERAFPEPDLRSDNPADEFKELLYQVA